MTWADHEEQREHLERVRDRIAPIIIRFCKEHGIGCHYRGDELRQYVKAEFPGIAPDSPGRIMRYLRERGYVDYVVVNRRASLYQLTRLGAAPEPRFPGSQKSPLVSGGTARGEKDC